MPEILVTPTAEHMVKLTIDGVEKLVPLTEIVAKAQKEGAAESRLEKATQTLREAEATAVSHKNALALYERFQGAKGGDPDKMRSLLVDDLGQDPAEYDAYVEALKEALAEPSEPPVPARAAADTAAAAAAVAPQFDPRTAEAVKGFIGALLAKGYNPAQVAGALTESLTSQGTQVVAKAIADGLDRSTNVRYALSGGIPREALTAYANAALGRRLGQTGEQLTAKDLQQVLLETDEFAKTLSKGRPAPTDEQLSIGGLSASGGLEAGHQPGGAKAPPVTDATAFDKWGTARLREIQNELESRGSPLPAAP